MAAYEWKDGETGGFYRVEDGEDRVINNGAAIWGSAAAGREIRRLAATVTKAARVEHSLQQQLAEANQYIEELERRLARLETDKKEA